MGLGLVIARWVALSVIPGVGARTIDRLLERFGSLDAVLTATDADLRAVPRIGPKLAAAIRAIDLDQVQADIDAWQADGIAILLREGDPRYPPALRSVSDAPPVLFARGAHLQSGRAVAVVGTRLPTRAAQEFAGALAAELAARGWWIVSGLAAGIDTAAHRGALRAGGQTVAVLGSGLRVIYPPENVALAAQIQDQGALLAEVHPDTPPNSPALVARNRLISGLSRAVFVIQAGASSGSLHAARFAGLQGRAVYVLEDDDAAGNRALIAAGARVLPPDFTAWDELSARL